MAQKLKIAEHASVFIEEDEILLNLFRENDPEVVQAVVGAEDPEVAVHRLLGVGARAVGLAGTTLDTAVVSSAFQQMTADFDRKVVEAADRITGTADDLLDEDGTLNAALAGFKIELTGLIEQTFDADSKRSALSKLDATMSTSADKLVKSIKGLLDPDADGSPLARYRQEVVREIRQQSEATTKAVQELSERIAVRRAEADVIELGTAKGFTFEELLHETLMPITTPFEDVAERVGTATGATGSKVGDEVVTINAADVRGLDACYVLEAKDRRVSSLKKMLDEVADAMANREAAAGLAVFSFQENAPTTTPFEFFGDKAIVVLDKDDPDRHALELACAWARWVVRRSLAEEADEVDLEKVGASVEEGRRAVARISSVRRAHSAAKNKIDEAAGQVEDLVTDLEAVLDAIAKELRA